MKIYTKTGDKGKTGLIGGTRVAKNDLRLEAYGTVDELNSYVGWLSTQEGITAEIVEFLRIIQNKLFTIGAHLATDRTKTQLGDASVMTESYISMLEEEMDRMEEQLAPLMNFVLPGGTQACALAHVCRTVTRRVERRIYDLSSQYEVDSQIHIFINRLSDYFFVLSRYLSSLSGAQEIYWKTLE